MTTKVHSLGCEWARTSRAERPYVVAVDAPVDRCGAVDNFRVFLVGDEPCVIEIGLCEKHQKVVSARGWKLRAKAAK